jgi:U3 small nucleolar RNA-associated protein 3
MPKKEKRPPTPPSSSEGEEEDYDSESYSGGGQNELPEITNKEHLLNYESDSSDQGGSDGKESSMDLAIGLKRQKQELEVGNVWGQSKKGFYGRDKKRDDETSSNEEDDEDEYKEALRL